jgi:hypothetical protein
VLEKLAVDVARERHAAAVGKRQVETLEGHRQNVIILPTACFPASLPRYIPHLYRDWEDSVGVHYGRNARGIVSWKWGTAACFTLPSSRDTAGTSPKLKVIAAEPVFAGDATLVAVTLASTVEGIAAGAVYNPVLLMLPLAGLIDQLTASVALVPVRQTTFRDTARCGNTTRSANYPGDRT